MIQLYGWHVGKLKLSGPFMVTSIHLMVNMAIFLTEIKDRFTQGPNYDMDAYMETLFGGEDLCWELGWVKKLDPTLNTSLANIVTSRNQDPTLMTINHIVMISWGSKVVTLSPCWDLLIWVGLGGLGPNVNRP